MSFDQLIPTFNAGELSPYLDARSDIEKYASGCRLLENFVIMPYGGVYRRPGTEFMGEAKSQTTPCRLLPFNFSTSTRFVLEAGERYIRFWSNGQQVFKVQAPDWAEETPYQAGDYVMHGGTVFYCLQANTSSADNFDEDLAAGYWGPAPALEVPTPYLAAELRAVQYVQINDVMYLVHPLHPVMKLSRLADDDWKMEEVAWDWPALLDENITETTITPSDTSGDGITLTASVPLFESGHVGSYWQLAHPRVSSSVAIDLVTTGFTSGLKVLGDWNFSTTGIWDATVTVERADADDGPWETIRSYTGEADRNVSATGKESKECWMRVNITTYHSHTGDTTPRAMLEVSDIKDYGIVQITAVDEGGLTATADVINDLFGDTATKNWCEGAWSQKQGFPRSVALHEQRLYYGGTAKKPQSIWASMIDDFENMRPSTYDDAGLFFTLSAQEANPIQWMTSQDRLLIGTAGEEWTLGSSDTNSTITPSNVKAVRQSSYGSKSLRAVVVNEVILFVQRQGRKVRELVYSFEKDGWVAPDLTVLAEHVTRGEILECAFQQQPDAIYWTVTGAGQLVGMTYERDQNVVGWHRHTTDGLFESVATIYGANGADEVWVAVQRTVKGRTRRFIERFKVDFRETFEAGDKADWWYLDCARKGSGTSKTVKALSQRIADLAWHSLPAHEASSVSFTNTTGVDITVRAQGRETLVHQGETWSIDQITNTSEVEYKAAAFGILNFDDVAFSYGTEHPCSGTFDLRFPVTGTPDSDGLVYAGDTQFPDNWQVGPYTLDANQNKIVSLLFQRSGYCGWGYNTYINIPKEENQYPEAGEQTLRLDLEGFAGDFPLYYDEDQYYDLTVYAGESYAPVDTVRTSSGTVSYEAAGDLFFEYTVNDSYIFTGLEHLEGKTVDVWADAAVQPSRTVKSGQITLQSPAEQVLAGLPYVSRLQPMKSEMSLPDGTSRGRKKRVNRVVVSTYQSLGGEVSTNGTDWNWLYSRDFADAMDSSPPLRSGDHEIVVAGGNGGSVEVTVRQAQPMPLTVLGVVVKYEANGD